MEKFQAELSNKMISQAQNISQRTAPEKEELSSHSCPPTLMDKTKRALIIEAAKRPMIILQKIQSATTQIMRSNY